MNTRLELVTRISVPVTDLNRQDNNKDNFKNIVSNLQELERLNNPQAEEIIIKLLSVRKAKDAHIITLTHW